MYSQDLSNSKTLVARPSCPRWFLYSQDLSNSKTTEYVWDFSYAFLYSQDLSNSKTINELYYSIVSKKRKAKAGNRNAFCQINPLDRESWKTEIEFPVITWR